MNRELFLKLDELYKIACEQPLSKLLQNSAIVGVLLFERAQATRRTNPAVESPNRFSDNANESSRIVDGLYPEPRWQRQQCIVHERSGCTETLEICQPQPCHEMTWGFASHPRKCRVVTGINLGVFDQLLGTSQGCFDVEPNPTPKAHCRDFIAEPDKRSNPNVCGF